MRAPSLSWLKSLFTAAPHQHPHLPLMSRRPFPLNEPRPGGLAMTAVTPFYPLIPTTMLPVSNAII